MEDLNTMDKNIKNIKIDTTSDYIIDINTIL